MVADRVVAVSPYVLTGNEAKRVLVIENGVDVNLYSPSPEARRRIREEMGLGEGLVFVFAGRWARHKGFDLLLRALESEVLQNRSFSCLIIGARAEDEPELLEDGLAKITVRGRIRVLGRVNDLPAYLNAGDVLLLPSRYEGLPLVFLEALATGLPVLASDIPVHQMLIRTAGCGWTFPSGRSEDLAKLMADISDNGVPPEWRELARRAAMRFSLDDVTDRYLAVYEDLLTSREQSNLSK